ncbi:unnamed protein product [Hymenolepis diminuta]|uniref:COesterase domain-containing protein n=2 Tax=Hymenolepis diminuta TaxID=6216 RepID=A0A158QCN0_HYMDI|nr:unnamed protein product [Hymenolepis diminuta]
MSFMSMALFFLFHCLSWVEQHSITVTRFPSIRTFALDGRVTVSGVEIRFSDPKLRHVHAVYGIRYASLGGEGSGMDDNNTGAKPEFPELSEIIQQAAKRRFMHSVAAFIYETPTRGHLQKTSPPPECPQPRGPTRGTRESLDRGRTARTTSVRQILQPTLQTEDCLTLNIFIPESRSDGFTEPAFPVLIFIHGDSYEYGSGNGYDFSLFSSLGGAIVVTLNYRLGLLGFLSDSSAGSARGNFALFDLQAAIQWVHSNIHRFGGDSEQITLMGHSHGAALVHLFATSMLSIGPNYYGIKRLILFDGSAEAPWATATCDTDIKSVIEANMQIPQSTSSTVFDLLQNLPVPTILEIQKNLSRMGLEKCFSPLPKKQQIITEKPTLFSRASLLYGQTEFAGSLFIHGTGLDENIGQLTPALNYLMEHVFRVSPYPLTDLLKYIYAHSNVWIENNNNHDEKNKINEIYTDALFWSPGLATLRQHESGQEQQSSEFDPPLESIRHVLHFSQARYGDDLNLLLGAPFISSFHLKSSLNRRLSQSLIQYISNFIHYGDPNKHFEIPNIAENLSELWPAFSIRNELALKIVKPAIGFSTSTSPEGLIGVISNHRKHFTTFWTDIFPKIAVDSKKPSTLKSNTITHFVVQPMVQYKDIEMNGMTTPSTSKIAEPTPISERLFTPSNESIEFPSFNDANQASSKKEVKDEDKSILLLTIVVGLSLFLLNIVFTATFYFCHQQHKDRNNGILIPASEADHRTNKNDATNKPLNDASSCQQCVVKLPGLTPAVNSHYQPQTGALPPPDFAHGTLQRTPNPMERHMYSAPMNQTTPLASHRAMTTLESAWNSDTLKRNGAGMI